MRTLLPGLGSIPCPMMTSVTVTPLPFFMARGLGTSTPSLFDGFIFHGLTALGAEPVAGAGTSIAIASVSTVSVVSAVSAFSAAGDGQRVFFLLLTLCVC